MTLTNDFYERKEEFIIMCIYCRVCFPKHKDGDKDHPKAYLIIDIVNVSCGHER